MIDIKLDLKGIPVPLRYQPIYKIVMLMAILKYGCQKPNNCNLLKLHFYMWALANDENLKILLEIKGKMRNSVVPWVFQPAMSKVITLAVINGLCRRDIKSADLRVQLMPEGDEVLRKIESLDIFTSEINKIKTVGIIPVSTITSVNKNWKLF